jgi:hypothetical protein
MARWEDRRILMLSEPVAVTLLVIEAGEEK